MLNVIDFREKAPRSRERERQRQPASAEGDIADLASRITSLHAQARGEIDSAVLMLDLAAQHAREIEKRMCGPLARNDFDEHIATIERLLQIAREMALKL
jgi:hypothetical protein